LRVWKVTSGTRCPSRFFNIVVSAGDLMGAV
jgi:hypothetical protein